MVIGFVCETNLTKTKMANMVLPNPLSLVSPVPFNSVLDLSGLYLALQGA